MRTIKFRVWCKTTKHFTDIPFYSCSGGQLLWHHTGNQITISNIDDGDYVIQQYTGLKDKNGKEIYEGDVLEEHHFEDWGDKEGFDYFGVVRYKTYPNDSMVLQLAGYVTYPNAEENKNYGGNRISLDCEVVGNIFENKDLLK